MSVVSSEVESLYPLDASPGVLSGEQRVLQRRQDYVAGRTALASQQEISAAGFELFVMSRYPMTYARSAYYRAVWESLSPEDRAEWTGRGGRVLDAARRVAIA